MAIDNKSRYKSTGTYTGTDTSGNSQEGLQLRAIPKTGGFFFYTPRPGERLDHVADKFFSDPKKFWKICDASDHMDPFDVVTPGVPVLIPPDK